jgi:hypothetical protein
MLEAWLYCVSRLYPRRSDRYAFGREQMVVYERSTTMLTARQVMETMNQRKVDQQPKAATRNDAAADDAEAPSTSDPKPLNR